VTRTARKHPGIIRAAESTSKSLLPLLAIGGSLAAAPATALELGDLAVDSTLGQPLRASIAFALGPNEQLADYCVSLHPAPGASGLPGIGQATVRVSRGRILLTGSTAIYEPLMSARLVVDCPYAPRINREYTVLVDPGRMADPTARPAANASRPAAVPAVRSAPAGERPVVSHEPIGPGTRYRVQPGDTLSQIVQRIENRKVGMWPAVNAIFAANPDAFLNEDPNRLKAGSWLEIPSFDGTAPVITAAATTAAEPAAPAPTVSRDVATAYEPPAPTESTATPSEDTVEPPADQVAIQLPVAGQPAETPTFLEPVEQSNTTDLKPGDIVLDSKNPFVDAAGPGEIADTPLPGPVTRSSSPNVPLAVVREAPSGQNTTSWLVWLAGGGIAILLVLAFFGRRLRRRFGSTPIGPVAGHAMRHEHAGGTDALADEIDYDISDDSPTEENLALDADLVLGTGLQDGTSVDLAQDFGFAATTNLDIELPFEPQAAHEDDDSMTIEETDIIPPMRDRDDFILDEEVLPDDTDYDMSVIMDATKMPQPDEVTERDLMAVEVDADDDSLISDDYTISKEVDYNILEQDYEEELTATQALNKQIEEAAAELAARMDEDSADDETGVLPKATLTELDKTSELPACDDVEEETDETSMSGALTVNMSAVERHADNDETAEMQIEGGKVDTKAG